MNTMQTATATRCRPLVDLPRRHVLGAGLGLLLGGAPLLQGCGGGGSASQPNPTPVPVPEYLPLAQPMRTSLHAAVAIDGGGALILGGSRGEPTLSGAIDRFDPATLGFTRVGSMLAGRVEHTATRLHDGRILVVGGATSEQIGNLAELIDPRSGRAAPAGYLHAPRGRHSATLLGDGRVLVCGGINRTTAEIWDPATQQWRLLASRMLNQREHHTATLLGNGLVFIAGGASADERYGFAELFDPASERFLPVDSAVTERREFHNAHLLSDGSVLIVGGEYTDGGATHIAAGVLRYRPVSNTWRAEPGLARPRTLAPSALLPDNSVALFGGQLAPPQYTASADRHLPGAGSVALAEMPVARAWHTVTRLAEGGILIVGGERADGSHVGEALIYRAAPGA